MHAAPPYEVVTTQNHWAVAVPGDYCRLSLPAKASHHRYMFVALPYFLGRPSSKASEPGFTYFTNTAYDHAFQRARLIFSLSGEDVFSVRSDYCPHMVAKQWDCVTSDRRSYGKGQVVWRNAVFFDDGGSAQYLLDSRDGALCQALQNSTPSAIASSAATPAANDPWPAVAGADTAYWKKRIDQPWSRRGNHGWLEYRENKRLYGLSSFTTRGARASIYPVGFSGTSAPNIVFLNEDGVPAVSPAKYINYYGSESAPISEPWDGPGYEVMVPGSFDSVRLHVEDTAPWVAFAVLLNVISTGNLPPGESYDCN